MSTTAVQKPQTIRDEVSGGAFKNAIAKVLPKHLTPDRMAQIAVLALTKTPKLAQCDRASFFSAMVTLSQLGLEPDGRRAHLIPFENRRKQIIECQLIIDYKGLAELAMRSGMVSNIHADIVCANDKFTYRNGAIEHEPNLREDRGEVFAAYAIARFKDGTERADAMSKSEIEAIRKRSRSANDGSWVTDWNEMAKKTVFRRLSKWLPLSPEFRDAVEIDDADTGFAIDVTPSVAAQVTSTPATPRKPRTIEAEVQPSAPAEPPADELVLQNRLAAFIAGEGCNFDDLRTVATEMGLLEGRDADAGAFIDLSDALTKKLLGAQAGLKAMLKKVKEDGGAR